MGFLENMESQIERLESQTEESGQQEQLRREADRRKALSAAPFAERLASGPFAPGLLTHATRAGYRTRRKVQPAWIGATLRLDAREHRLELEPTPAGVEAVFFEDGREVRRRPLDLDSAPEDLVAEWLGTWSAS